MFIFVQRLIQKTSIVIWVQYSKCHLFFSYTEELIENNELIELMNEFGSKLHNNYQISTVDLKQWT